MFISHINKNYKFDRNQWVLSIVDFPQEQDASFKASIIVEGVVNRKLLFASYDVYSKRSDKSSPEKPRAYIHHIDYFESSRYRGDFTLGTSISYHALPNQCQKLSDHIHGIAQLFQKKDPRDIAPELIIFPISIEKSSLHWCLNFLGDHNILHQSALGKAPFK